MNESLFVGLMIGVSIYAASALIPQLSRRFHLLPICLVTVCLYTLVYWVGAVHFPPSERLLRGVLTGSGIAIAGAVLSLVQKKKEKKRNGA